MRSGEKWTISDVIYLVKPETTDKFMWKLAFEDETFVLRGCHYFGWDGGTIHQLIYEVLKRQEEMGLSY